MADDSLEVQKDEVPFHPCLTPRGMTWYDLNVLTPLQQKLLNELKVEVVRENNMYLARHPEIRAIIAIFLRAILKEQPKLKTLAEIARDFFSRQKSKIQEEIDEYLKERGEPLKKEGDSALDLEIEEPSERSTIGDLSSFYQPDYYTYVSYTEEPSSVEEVEDWGSDEDVHRFFKPPSTTIRDQSDYEYTRTMSGTSMTDSEFERRQFELLFASRASIFSGESIEESTLDMTREYIESYGGIGKDREDEEESKLQEMQGAEERLSVILEHLEGEEVSVEHEDYYDYEELNKITQESLTEMDIGSLKDKSSLEGEIDDEIEPRPSQKSAILKRFESASEHGVEE